MDEKLDKYIPICTRKQIGEVFYPHHKDPSNPIGRIANDGKKIVRFKAMDMGAYCMRNKITSDMLREIDSDTLKILINLSNHMKDKLCNKNSVSPELIEEFNMFMEHKQILQAMKDKK